MTRFEGFAEMEFPSPVPVRTVSFLNPHGNRAFGDR